MPLVRVEVRNEYGLGAAELYKETNREDPKAVLDGVAVAGLVGILRQLGDLAEFAAEVFHGLQEEVMITSSRSHKLMARVQHIEAALSPLEKAVLAQRSHIHFAYTAGSNWHARIRCEENHFIYDDMPRFIMDSYEECRSPPRLHVLDKFDPGGPGSCLKRYSDPTFFRRASLGSDGTNIEKLLKDKKGRRIKKKRSLRKSREMSRGVSLSSHSGRMQFIPRVVDWQSSPSGIVATHGASLKTDLGYLPNSIDTRNGFACEEHVLHPHYPFHPEEREIRKPFSPLEKQHQDSIDYSFLNERDEVAYEVVGDNLSQEQAGYSMHHEERQSEKLFSLRQEPNNDYSFDYSFLDEKSDIAFGDLDDNLSQDQTCPSSSASSNREAKSEEQVSTEEQEPKESSSPLRSSSVDFGFLHETGELLHDDIGNNLSKEQAGTGSSVTWVEKAEILKPGTQEENLDTLSNNSNPGFKKNGTINSEIVNQLDFQVDIQNEARPFSGDVQPDDIESETDNYMDALNTIESESDADLDCQTKHEVENSHRIEMDNGMDGLAPKLPHCISQDIILDNTNSFPTEGRVGDSRNSVSSEPDFALNQLSPKLPDFHSPNDDATNSSPMLDAIGDNRNSVSIQLDFAPCNSSEKQKEITDIVSSEYCPDLELPPTVNQFLISDDLVDVNSFHSGNVLDSTKSESVVSPTENTSEMPQIDKVRSNFDSQKPPVKPSSITSVSFWTNGGLLGLEPSKPPDFGVLNGVSQVSAASKDDLASASVKTDSFVSGKHARKPDMLEKVSQSIEDGPSSKCPASSTDDQGKMFTKKLSGRFSPADLDVGLGKSEVHHQNSGGAFIPLATNGSQEKGQSSSRILELGNRLLVNGFDREQSAGFSSNFASSLSNDPSEQKTIRLDAAHRTFSARTKDFSGSGSPIMSPSSSPPLGHMKISFQPLDGFETSKLKLKFPERDGSESSRDMFASFQLVPDPAFPLHDTGLDSDGDTFCRSSPYMSDDCLSEQSDSNSEQWESGESLSSKDHEFYDALRRVSLTGSTSVSLDTVETPPGEIHDNFGLQIPFTGNVVERSGSGHLFDLPSMDNLKPSVQELRNGSNMNNLTEAGSTPLPPPLPPAQWRAMKPHSDFVEDMPDAESPNYPCDSNISGSIISQQPKPAPFMQEQDHENEATSACQSKQPVIQKSQEQKEDNQLVHSKIMDEKEDFLQQIRAKSFSLKRTIKTRPTSTAAPHTSVKVTAILEKANAIRQAVASDDGEDNWSDT